MARRRKNSHAKRTKPRSGGGTVTTWLRTPVEIPRGRRLRVLIYARYSTDEQNPRSIADQVAYCRRFLDALGLKDVEVTVLSDEGISGEIVSRPGIDQVYAGCLERRWNLILCEDASRLYRHETACGELIETAVDEGIRVVCINDFTDTQEEDWEDRLHEALRHHAKANHYTSRRIKRALSALWEMGAAIGLPKPGYHRNPSTPATDREPAKGPFFDEIDLRWVPVIREAFERIAAGDAPDRVAEWLTAIGLPKAANAKYSEWNGKNVIALIRRTDYRGFETYRETVCKKKHRTGKRTQVPNDPDKVLTREMPHLRIVSDHVWHQANDAIDDRITAADRPSGSDHPLSGIPRDSRMPLSRILVCAICGERTHVIGSNGYRCRNTTKRARPGVTCWNRASTKSEIAHRAIRDALLESIEPLKEPHTQQTVVQAVAELLVGDDQTSADRKTRSLHLLQEKQKLEDILDNLTDVVEQGSSVDRSSPQRAVVPTRRLVKQIEKREEELDRVLAELEDLDSELSVQLSGKDLAGRVEEFEERLQCFNRSIQCDLQQLVGTIEAVPYQQFGCDKVVLRGRFVFDPYKLLPAHVRLALEQLHGDRLPERLPGCLQPVAISVELFEPSTGPRYWQQALYFQNQNLGLTAIGKKLGITKRKANLAVQYGKALREAGLTDPFTELTESPAVASRWRSRRRRSQSDR